MDRRRFHRKKGKLLVIAGCCCIFAAVALYAYNSLISARAYRESENLLSLLKSSENTVSAETERRDSALGSPSPDSGMKRIASKSIGGYEIIGTLEAGTIGVRLPVISGWSYPKLRAAPCRYSGTPDTQMVLLAHNYENHFGRLKNLKTGDTVTFTDVKNKKYRYRVIRNETIAGNDLKAILSGKDWNLTLFTCTYSGAERVVVRCCRY